MATDVKPSDDQYIDYVWQRQDAYLKTIQSWWENWADVFYPTQPNDTTEARPYGPSAFVDRYFDAWEKGLKLQREAWHRVLDATTYAAQASEDVAEK